MKNLLFILIALTLINCGNNSTLKNHSIIGMTFQNFNQIKQLENYKKVSDTSIIGNNFDPKYGILHLQDKLNNLVIFKSITLDSIRDETYKVLDTLIIPNSKKSEFITIGYCDIDYGNSENIIAIVDKTDSLRIQFIKKVWKANTDTERIERVKGYSKYGCYNEFYVDN